MIIPIKSLEDLNKVLNHHLSSATDLKDRAEIIYFQRVILKSDTKTINVSMKEAIFLEVLLGRHGIHYETCKEIYDYIRRQFGLENPAVIIPKTGYPAFCPNCGGDLGKEENHRHEDCNGNPYGYKSKTCSRCFHSVTLPGSEW